MEKLLNSLLENEHELNRHTLAYFTIVFIHNGYILRKKDFDELQLICNELGLKIIDKSYEILRNYEHYATLVDVNVSINSYEGIENNIYIFINEEVSLSEAKSFIKQLGFKLNEIYSIESMTDYYKSVGRGSYVAITTLGNEDEYIIETAADYSD